MSTLVTFSTAATVAGAAVVINLLLTILPTVIAPTYPTYPVSAALPSVLTTTVDSYVDPDLNHLTPEYLHDANTVALWTWVKAFQPKCHTTCAAVKTNGLSFQSFSSPQLLRFTGLSDTVYCFETGIYYLNTTIPTNTNNYFIGCPNSVVYVSNQLTFTASDHVYLNGLTFDSSSAPASASPNFTPPPYLEHLYISNCTFANFYGSNQIFNLHNTSVIYDNLFYNASWALGGTDAISTNIVGNLFYNVNNHVDLGYFGSQGFLSHFVFNNNTIIVDGDLLAAGYQQIVNLEGKVFSPMQIRNNRVSCNESCPSWFVVNQAGNASWLCPTGNFTIGWITNNSFISNVSSNNDDSYFSDFGPLTSVLVKNNTFEIVGNAHRGFPFALETISSVLFVNNTFIGNSLGSQMNPYGSGGGATEGFNVCGGVLPIESMNTFATNYFYNTVSLTWESFSGTDYKGGSQWPAPTCGNGGSFVPCCHPFTPLDGQRLCQCGSTPYYGGDLTITCNLPGSPPSNLELNYYFGTYLGVAFTAVNADSFSVVINDIRKDDISNNYAIYGGLVTSEFNVTIPPSGPITVPVTIVAVNRYGEVNGTLSFTVS